MRPKMKAILVAGARPNFMKIAPLLRAIAKYNPDAVADPALHRDQRGGHGSPITAMLVHTGQHYDYQMSQVFFQDLKLPEPDVYLGVGSGSHAEQTARVMVELEKVLVKEQPDLVVVVGDVNSTVAAALTAAKLHIPVAHVEAGLRSGDRAMPEEINRLLTDQISDYLFTPSGDADENLQREGIPRERIFLVGNVMIDSLLYNRPLAEKSDILERLGLSAKEYALLTLHRPSNVDDEDSLARIMRAITTICRSIHVVFPAHPRTQKKLEEFGLLPSSPAIAYPNELNEPKELNELNKLVLTPPLSYLDFLKLEIYARFVMTDSGGIQEETTVLGVPCLTLRDTTERPITITHGTNVLVGTDPQRIIEQASRILASPRPPNSLNKPEQLNELNKLSPSSSPPLWDGRTAERIISVLACNRQ